MADLNAILGLVQNVLGKSEDDAKKVVEEHQATGGSGGILEMIQGFAGTMSPQDTDHVAAATNVASKIGITDVAALLQDGKIDMGDLATLGSIVSKMTK